MKSIVKALHRPSVACLVISLVVLAAVLAVRAQGWLQRAELTVYDHFVKARSDSEPNSTDERIAIVGMTEDDLEKYGFPLDDERMAQVLERIDAQQPAAIGLDMYRDLPEPRDRSKYPAIEAAFKKLERVIAIQRVGYVKPPPALADQPDRLCANNLEKDFSVDGNYRRGPLAIERDVPEPIYSLSLAVTLKYLELHQVVVEPVEVPGHPEAPLFRLGKTVFPRLTANAGGYVGLDVHDYEYLVDFRAPRRFRVQDARGQLARDTPYDYSFGDVIEGRVPPGALKGKIVFVGTVMQSIKDSNPTPIDDNLRGMHQHVMMTHQLLDAAIAGVKPKTWWPEWAEVAWIAAATLLGGALGLMFRSPWKLAPALALLLGGIGFAGWEMFQHGTWLLVAAPGLGGFVSATLVTSFIAYLEKSERGDMESLFSRHVSPKVVEALWAERDQFLDGGRLKPQRLTATVLFTDLKGFSTTSEKMDPATLMEWMNEYMNGVARHVDLNHGIINKFIGDAIMAVFGVPLAHTREEEMDADAVHAVTCALAMRAEIAALNASWSARGLPTTAMRIGIQTGALVAGSFGSEERLEFTVLGDTVNTAARLEAAGKDAASDPRTVECTILIGDSTAQRLHGRFETHLLGPISLKGKADKIVVHSVLGVRQDTAAESGSAHSPTKQTIPSNL